MENDMENELQEQTNSRPWLFKKGQSGNPSGRKVGTKSLKTRAREYLMGLTDEEAEEFFAGLNKLDVWKMAEGMPQQDTDITSDGKALPTPLLYAVHKEGNDELKEKEPLPEEN